MLSRLSTTHLLSLLIAPASFLQSASCFSVATNAVKWGVVLGGTSEDQATLEAFQRLKGGELVAVLSQGEDGKHSVDSGCTLYERRDDFLADERIDAVWIGTPPGQHLFWAMHVASVRHSFPNVQNPPRYICVSRPMLGRSYEETTTMAAALQARKLTLYPAPLLMEHRLRFVQENMLRIGDLKRVKYQYVLAEDVGIASWQSTADIHGGGVLIEKGPVVLRFLEMLLGPLEDVKGEALNRNSPNQDVEDYVWMQAHAGSVGVDCIWDMTRVSEISRDVLILEGESGTLRVEGVITEPVVKILDDRSGDLVERRDFDNSPFSCTERLQEVTENIQNEKQQTDLKATFRLSSNIDRILRSYYGGRGDDFFARPATWPGIPPSRRQLYLEQQGMN